MTPAQKKTTLTDQERADRAKLLWELLTGYVQAEQDCKPRVDLDALYRGLSLVSKGAAK